MVENSTAVSHRAAALPPKRWSRGTEAVQMAEITLPMMSGPSAAGSWAA